MKALACTLAAVVVTAWASVAVALDITFDDVVSVGNPSLTMLDTQGYRFTGALQTIDTPGGALVSNASAVYLGQEASGPGITVARADGGPFTLYEFDAAGLYGAPAPGSPNAQQVSLAGLRVGGPGAFARDDVGVSEGPTSVSGPGTLALALLAALGAGGVALTRRRGQRFRHR